MRATLLRARAFAETHIARLTPRERALVAVVACLLAVLWAANTMTTAAAAQDRLADLRAEVTTRTRLAQAQNSERFRAALTGEVRNARAWSVSASTVEIARVRAQGLVEDLAAQAGVGNAIVSVERATPDDAPVQRIAMHLDGAYDATSFHAFLTALSESEQSLTPVSIDVDEGRNRLRMGIVALYIAPERAP